MDAGGLTREWYTILAREIFDERITYTTKLKPIPDYHPD